MAFPSPARQMWMRNHFSANYKRPTLPLARSTSEHLGSWQLCSFFLILTGRSTEHAKWLLPSVGPCDGVGGSVIATAEVCAKHRLQLHMRGATGDVFISEPRWSPWCEVAEACPECLCSLLGCEPRGTGNDSIFSKLAHGPEVSGNCHYPTKSNTTARNLCLSMKQIYPVEALSGTAEAAPCGRRRC